MAKSVIINSVTYSSVPEVKIPQVGGGTAVFRDTSDADIGASDVRSGKKAYGANGEVLGNLEEITATTTTITSKSQVVTIAAGIHTGAGKVQLSAADQATLVAGNIKSGVSILGVNGGLSAATISQDSSTKALTIA